MDSRGVRGLTLHSLCGRPTQAQHGTLRVDRDSANRTVMRDAVEHRVVSGTHHDQIGVVCRSLAQNLASRIAARDLDIYICAGTSAEFMGQLLKFVCDGRNQGIRPVYLLLR